MLAWANPGLPRLVPSPEQMSDMQPVDLNSASLDIGRHVRGIADPFNGHIDPCRISHVPRSDGWIETTWNNMSDPGPLAGADAEAQEGGEPPPLAGAGVVVCLMGQTRLAGAEEQDGGGGEPPPLAGAGVVVCLMA